MSIDRPPANTFAEPSHSQPGETLVPHGYLVRAGKQPTYYKIFPGNVQLSRGDSIICRTTRGVELAEVLADLDQSVSLAALPDVESDGPADQSDGIENWPQAKWLRLARHEDHFLLSKLEEMSREASDACQSYLESQNSSDVLLEVEPLLDGRTLFFHFLGQPSPETELVIDRLANEYQSTVAKSRFAELVEKGCGPGCGTKEKSGCGTSQGCAVCAIAGGCTKG